jgi:hypothetical protein
MLLFHGTRLDRAGLDSVLDEGLRPFPKEWACSALGAAREPHDPPHDPEAGFVFLATSPVSGRGGDPLGFALGWGSAARRSRPTPGYIVVVQVPEPARGHLLGAVPNHELEQFWRVRRFLGCVERDLLPGDLLALREVTAPWRERLVPVVTHLNPGLPPATSADQLQALMREWDAARTRRDKRRILRASGATVAAEDLEDSHTPFCADCTGTLFGTVELELAGLPARPPRARQPSAPPRLRVGAAFQGGLDVPTVGLLLDALGRWLRAHPAEAVARAVQAGAAVAKWARALEVPRDQVPRPLWPDFLTRFTDEDLRSPDTQVLLAGVPASWLLGVLRVSDDGHTLRPGLSGGGGPVLSELWRRTHLLRQERSAAGRPPVL